MNYTLGAINKRFEKNGTKIVLLTDVKAGLENLRKISIEQKRNKSNAIALLTYGGVRGTFTSSNVFFIDIDTTVGVDTLVENRDKLFAVAPNILFIQKSFSNKLHICCVHKETYDKVDDWVYNTKLNTLTVIELIKKHFNIDYFTIENGVDLHSFNWTALLYVSNNEIYFNDLCVPVSLDRKSVRVIEEKYAECFDTWKERGGVDVSGRYESLDAYKDGDNKEKLLVDRNVKVGELSGNELRWRISRIADAVFGGDAKSWCDKHFYFENRKSIYSKVKKDIALNKAVLNWLVVEGYISIKVLEKQLQTEINTKTIEMDDGKWMSDYIPCILDYIHKEKVLTIQAPPGAGKTTMMKEIAKYFKEPFFMPPFNVTNNLYKPMNIVSSQTGNEYEQGKPNVGIWDVFCKNHNLIYPDVIFVDESHELFLSRTYRDSAIKAMELLREWLIDRDVHLVFVSATPTAEVQMFNSFLLKFNKKDDRDVKVEVHFTNNTSKCVMRDLRMGGFDRVCVFSDRDAQLGYANALAKSYNATIYHSEWKDNVDRLRNTEMLDHVVSFLTCIAFSGLNIRNENEKILIDIRYVWSESSFQQMEQIIGRFRANKDITVRMYVDGKYGADMNLEETFENAKVIMENDSLEVVNEWWKRMNEKNVQSALREIEVFYKSQDVVSVIGMLKKLYPVKLYKDNVEEGYSYTDPEKKKQSDLFKKYLVEGWKNVELDYSNKYIREWMNRIRNITGMYDVDAEECMKKLLSENKNKSGRLVSTILEDLNGILNVMSFDDAGWEEEKRKRQPLLDSIKGSKLVKALMSRFKRSDEWRKKYKGWKVDDVMIDFAAELDAMFDAHQVGRSEGGRVTKKKNNVKRVTDGINVWDSCKDAAIALGRSQNAITDRIKKGTLWIC